MFEKWILYTFIRATVKYVYFEYTVPVLDLEASVAMSS
jgi:hypothetical protein